MISSGNWTVGYGSSGPRNHRSHTIAECSNEIPNEFVWNGGYLTMAGFMGKTWYTRINHWILQQPIVSQAQDDTNRGCRRWRRTTCTTSWWLLLALGTDNGERLGYHISSTVFQFTPSFPPKFQQNNVFLDYLTIPNMLKGGAPPPVYVCWLK